MYVTTCPAEIDQTSFEKAANRICQAGTGPSGTYGERDASNHIGKKLDVSFLSLLKVYSM